MAYLGNTPTTQGFIPAIDYFSGNGATTAFTLSRPVASVAQVQATIENVPQNPGTAFTVSGNTITFDGAPPSGTNNIYVYYTSPITQVIQPGQGTVGTAQLQSGVLTPAAVSDQNNSSTGYFDLPTGTTAQRPASPINGMARYNSTINKFEVYENGGWVSYDTSYTAEYLVVAGAGGGGNTGNDRGAGGGGAGGLLTGTATFFFGSSYSVTVGAGGAGGAAGGGNQGASGQNSSLSTLVTAIGGGGGGRDGISGNSGGSGGGAGNSGGSGTVAGGAGTSGQGFAGGTAELNSAGSDGGGGGGAGGVGTNGGSSKTFAGVGLGGPGVASSISGSSVTYAAGGRGSGSSTSYMTGTAGAANTGNGGGGSNGGNAGAAGGSGIVVIRYPGAQRGTGGTVTSAGGFTIHTFTTSGTYTA